MLEAKQPLESLSAAENAAEAAQRADDTVGEALSQQARAKALQDLQRNDEASKAWQQAAEIWAEVGETPGQIRALVQAGLHSDADHKDQAQKFYAQGLALGRSETQHPASVAQALYDSGVLLQGQRQIERAWDYLSAAVPLWEKQAPESLKLVNTLILLARVTMSRAIQNEGSKYYHLGRDYSSRAAEICRHVAPGSLNEVQSLHLLGRAEYLLEDFAHGREHFLAAVQIDKKIEPTGSMEEAAILRELGVLEHEVSNFAAARADYEQAVALGERLAPTSPDYERSLENLANLENVEGDLAAARAGLERAQAINEAIHGNLAPTFINLGAVALAQSDYASARDYFQKALDLFVKAKSKTAGEPIALGNLSETFFLEGDFASALEYRKRSLALMQERLGDSLSQANHLDGMGDILLAQGHPDEAAAYYHKALDMQQKIASHSMSVTHSLGALAKVARSRKNTALAMEYDRRALDIGQQSCPNSWCVAWVLNDLGEIAYEQRDLASSESYLRRAIDVQQKSLGLTHPDLARSLNALALTVAAQGKTPQALETALRAERIGTEHLRVSVRTLSERQALAYENIRASGLDLALTLAGNRSSPSAARAQVLDAVIRSRAVVFDELASRHRSSYRSGDPHVIQLADQLLSARTRLATLVFRGAGDAPPETYRKLLDDTREQKETAERELAQASISFRQDQARAQLGSEQIAAALPPGAALVSFVRYLKSDLQEPAVGKDAAEPVLWYAAFVLCAEKREPDFLPLGTAREIDGLVAAWRRNIARQAEALDPSSRTNEESYRRVAAALRHRIWDPLRPAIGNAREIFIVPDAALHLVNLASLPSGSSQYLIETEPLIHYLSTERDLVPAQSRQGEGILIVGNPAFDHAGKPLVATNKQSALAGTAVGTEGALLRGSRSACGTFQTLRFPALPGSQLEAENIAALWKTGAEDGLRTMRGVAARPSSGELLQMTGVDASAEAFEQYAPGKRVLHVATHGFFLEGSCESVAQRRLDASKRDASFLPATAENPLLLSGLAFAGANRRASAKPDETDGIMTAEEIAGINLDGVDWAVLSACDTGLGEIKIGEGVFGLRRAFQVAGAKTVIMSLWPVEDETTRQWMETLYGEHFLSGKDTVESVRAASLRVLRQRRAKHQSTHPFYWGAFIAAGDWH
jgi:CHAT domain-containing protein/tetratricopeptide (TPR) repeat protein